MELIHAISAINHTALSSRNICSRFSRWPDFSSPSFQTHKIYCKYKQSIFDCSSGEINLSIPVKIDQFCVFTKEILCAKYQAYANKVKIFVNKIFTKIQKLGIPPRRAGQIWTNLGQASCQTSENIVQKLQKQHFKFKP